MSICRGKAPSNESARRPGAAVIWTPPGGEAVAAMHLHDLDPAAGGILERWIDGLDVAA